MPLDLDFYISKHPLNIFYSEKRHHSISMAFYKTDITYRLLECQSAFIAK